MSISPTHSHYVNVAFSLCFGQEEKRENEIDLEKTSRNPSFLLAKRRYTHNTSPSFFFTEIEKKENEKKLLWYTALAVKGLKTAIRAWFSLKTHSRESHPPSESYLGEVLLTTPHHWAVEVSREKTELYRRVSTSYSTPSKRVKNQKQRDVQVKIEGSR